jgi:tripartite-type tricarboxylate transporter receptor subunit TctC
MTFSRRQLLKFASLATISRFLPQSAQAQTYPARPLHWVVGYPPGGSADVVARLMGDFLSDKLGQPVVIENKPGAGNNVGTEAVVRAPADGYTLLLVNPANAINATLYSKLSFNFLEEIQPIAGILQVPNVVEVHPSVPVNTFPELIAYAKEHPDKINMASGGNGVPSHLAGELFKMMTGVNVVHVPYRGSAPALIDLLSGRVQLMFDPLPTSREHIKAGRLRPLAVTTLKRSEALPNLPTVNEFLPGYEASTWYGLGLPAKTSTQIAEVLNKTINAGLADPKLQARLIDLGGWVIPGPSADFRKLVVKETEKWGKVIREAGISPI